MSLPRINLEKGKGRLMSPRAISFLDLPDEMQVSIFSYAKRPDLIRLALVSRRFLTLAATHLYRRLEFFFEDDRSASYNQTVCHLTKVLETLATSDYNYAQHVKSFHADSRNDRGDYTCDDYHYSSSSGKLLNAMLLASLKRVRALESFRWNVRIELSPAIYEALSKFPTLVRLHVRLPRQDQPVRKPSSVSYPQAPPAGLNTPFLSTSRNAKTSVAKRDETYGTKFSKFKGLSYISILDIESIQYVPGIAKCIQSSSGTVKTLKLSLSEKLALKARRVTTPSESDSDSDVVDEFSEIAVPLPPGMSPQISGTGAQAAGPVTSEVEVRRERAAQEKILARIFGLEELNPRDKKLEQNVQDAIDKADKESEDLCVASRTNNETAFVEKLKEAVQTMQRNRRCPTEGTEKTLEMIEMAASIYLKNVGGDTSSYKKTGQSSGTSKHKIKVSKKSIKPPAQYFSPYTLSQSLPPGSFAVPIASVQDKFPDLFSHMAQTAHLSSKKKKSGSKKYTYSTGSQSFLPMDMISTNEITALTNSLKNYAGSLHHPPDIVIQTEVVPQTPTPMTLPSLTAESSMDAKNNSGLDLFASNSSANQDNKGPKMEEDPISKSIDMEHPDVVDDEGEDQEFLGSSEALLEEIANVNSVSGDTTGKSKGKSPIKDLDEVPSGDQAIQDYIKKTHGLHVERFSLYLIPMKASVLARAIDPFSLKQLVLLNVGPQKAYWAMLGRLQKFRPLSLQSIFTDNVTPALLVFLHGLESLEELFLLERSSKTKVETFTPKTLVTAEEIKNQVLSVHLPSLKRLMIKNEDDSSWDFSPETLRLVCKLGGNLRELSFATDSKGYHCFIRNVHQLKNLIAIHVHAFRTSDSCPATFRELINCAIDMTSRLPNCRINHIGLNDCLAVIQRDPTSRTNSNAAGLSYSSDGVDTEGNEKERTLWFRLSEVFRTIDMKELKIWSKCLFYAKL